MKKNRTIFIGGLIDSISTKDIDSYFGQFGKIKNIVFKKNKVLDERRTFAYLVFEDKDSADKALGVYRHVIKGKRIDCQPAHGGKDKTKDVEVMIETKIHLKGLPVKVTSDDLQAHFTKYGEIRQAYVVFDSKAKKSKCFGFVQFYDPNVTNVVLQRSHFLLGKKIKCESFIPKDKNVRGENNADNKDEYNYSGKDSEITMTTSTQRPPDSNTLLTSNIGSIENKTCTLSLKDNFDLYGHEEEFDQLMFLRYNSLETSPDKIKPIRKSSSSEICKAVEDKEPQYSSSRYLTDSENDYKKYSAYNENTRNKPWSKNPANYPFDMYNKPQVYPQKKSSVQNPRYGNQIDYNHFKSPSNFQYNGQMF